MLCSSLCNPHRIMNFCFPENKTDRLASLVVPKTREVDEQHLQPQEKHSVDAFAPGERWEMRRT